MRDSSGGQKKPTREVQAPRSRKPRLEPLSRDSTNPKKALQSSEQLYRAIMENDHFGIALIDLNYKILMVNNTVSKNFCKPVCELIGRDCFREFEKRESICPHCPGRRVIATGQPAEAETEGVRDDGSRFSVRIQAFPAKRLDGVVTGFIKVVEDVTEYKKAEQQFQKQGAVLNAINKVFRQTLTCETGEQVAKTCLKVAEELTGSKFGFIGEVNERGRFDSTAISDPGWDACRVPRSDAVRMIKDMEVRGIWGSVLKGQQSLIVNEPASHRDRVGIPEGHPPITCFLGVPLKQADETIGMIGLANKESGYDRADQEAVEALSVAFVEALYRKRAEETLRKSEERYRTLYESSRDGIVTADLKGNITECNQAYANMLGYSREELKKISYQDVTPSKWHVFNEKIFQEVMELGYSGVFEREYVRKDRTVFPVSLHAWRIDNEDGNPAGVGFIVRDITERKKAEEKLSQALIWQEAIFEGSRDAIFISDENSRFVAVNRAACELTGYSKAELLSMRIPGLHKPEDLTAYNLYHDRIMAGEEIVSEAKILRKDGTKVDTEFNNRCIRISGMPYMHTVARDITERKRAELLLRKERDKAQKYLDVAAVMLVAIDSEQRVGLINKKGCQILGYKEEEILAKNWFDNFLPDSIKDQVREIFEKTVRGQIDPPKYYENPILTKNGQERLIAWHNTILRDEKGEVIATLSSGEDITERKKAEEALRESEKFFCGTLNNLLTFIGILEPNGKVIFVNNTPLEAAGIKAEDVMEKMFYETYWWAYSEQARETIKKDVERCASGETFVREIQAQMAGGTLMWVEFSMHPIYDEQGKVKYLVPEGRDITERKKAETKLLDYQAKLKSLASQLTLAEERERRR
ncbi:MAG: PAS domain S-box protein, partial [Sedimentisphaerales bacterium]